MMNKTRITALILCLLLLAATSCAKAPTAASEAAEATEAPAQTAPPAPTPKPHSAYNELLENAEVVRSSASFVEGFYKSTLREVENASCYIILATVIGKEQIDETTPEEKQQGKVDGFTETTLQIEKIYKDNGELTVGDTMVICEKYYLFEGLEGQTCIKTIGQYYPAKEYETYLFFLEPAGDGVYYSPTSRWFGKYPVTSAAVTAQAENALSYEALEIVAPYDAEGLSEDLAGIFGEICEKYFADEAVLAVLEREEPSAEK